MRPQLILVLALAACVPKHKTKSGPSPAPASAPVEATPAPRTGAESPVPGEAPPVIPVVRVEKRLDKAAGLLTTGSAENAREALVELKDISVSSPDLAEVPYDMGVAYLQLGDDINARKQFLRATDIDPTLAVAWLNLGAMSEREGELERALLNYEAGLRHSPEDSELVVGQISVLRKLGRYEAAITKAKAALAHNANNINAYDILGQVYLDQGNTDLAKFVFTRALNAIDGADSNARIHTNLGRVYVAQDNVLLARKEFTRALELDPRLVPAKMELARLELNGHAWEKAARLLEEARDLEPNSAPIRMNLGIAYRGLGRFEEAKSAYQKALELNPTDPTPHLNLAVLLADHMKVYDQALAEVDAYYAAGGKMTPLASTWKAAIEQDKLEYEKMLDRKKKQEEAKKRREERDRLAAEARAQEEAQKKADEEAARKAAEEAARPTPPQPAPPEAPTAVPAPEPTSPPEPQPTEATPWGSAGGSAASAACSGLGTCADPTLECAQDAVCRPAGGPGTFFVGAACASVADCAYGLSCDAGVCGTGVAPQAPATETPNPWGG